MRRLLEGEGVGSFKVNGQRLKPYLDKVEEEQVYQVVDFLEFTTP